MVWKSGQSYSTALRSRVLAAIDGGSPAKATARLCQVSVSCIYKALARRAATGETEARPQRNRQTLKLKNHHAAIAAEVARRRTSRSRSCGRGCSRPTRSRPVSA
jgi:transposase